MMKFLAICLFLTASLFADGEYLFIIHSKEARYDAKNGTLTLLDVDHSVTYFSDDKPRRAGKTTLTSFLFNLLGEDKRFTAGVIYFLDNDDYYSDVEIELSDPHYSFENSQLSFHIEVSDPHHRLLPKMSEVNLFVEDVPEDPSE